MRSNNLNDDKNKLSYEDYKVLCLTFAYVVKKHGQKIYNGSNDVPDNFSYYKISGEIFNQYFGSFSNALTTKFISNSPFITYYRDHSNKYGYTASKPIITSFLMMGDPEIREWISYIVKNWEIEDVNEWLVEYIKHPTNDITDKRKFVRIRNQEETISDISTI